MVLLEPVQRTPSIVEADSLHVESAVANEYTADELRHRIAERYKLVDSTLIVRRLMFLGVTGGLMQALRVKGDPGGLIMGIECAEGGSRVTLCGIGPGNGMCREGAVMVGDGDVASRALILGGKTYIAAMYALGMAAALPDDAHRPRGYAERVAGFRTSTQRLLVRDSLEFAMVNADSVLREAARAHGEGQ